MTSNSIYGGFLFALILSGCAQVDDLSDGQATDTKRFDSDQTDEYVQSPDDSSIYSGDYLGDGSTYPGDAPNVDDGRRADNRSSKVTGCAGDRRMKYRNLSISVIHYAYRRVRCNGESTRHACLLRQKIRVVWAVYRLITNRAVESVEAGDYKHPEWAQSDH